MLAVDAREWFIGLFLPRSVPNRSVHSPTPRDEIKRGPAQDPFLSGYGGAKPPTVDSFTSRGLSLGRRGVSERERYHLCRTTHRRAPKLARDPRLQMRSPRSPLFRRSCAHHQTRYCSLPLASIWLLVLAPRRSPLRLHKRISFRIGGTSALCHERTRQRADHHVHRSARLPAQVCDP